MPVGNTPPLGNKKAAHVDSVVAHPANQPSGPMVRFGKHVMDDKAELDAFITATDNRGPTNDLYDRINFLRNGKRTPNKPNSY